MRVRRLPSTLAALAVAAVVLGGCSSAAPEAEGASPERTSPLSEYLDAVYGGDLSPEEQQAKYDEQDRRTEELVAECMQEEGFEYLPNDNSGTFSTGEDVVYEPEDREWVEQWGYAAAKSPYNEESAQPTEEYVDANEDYVASLSESEQTAFYEALNGPMLTEEEYAEQGDSYEYDWTTAGCYGAAQHEVQQDDPAQSEEFAPLFEAMNGLYEDIASSPEMTALDGEWSACMDGAGQPGFATQADAQNSIYDQLNTFYESGSEGEEYVEPDPSELDALHEEEVALALVDLTCREETDYRERYAEVQAELEEQFIADHQAELDALRAAAEQD